VRPVHNALLLGALTTIVAGGAMPRAATGAPAPIYSIGRTAPYLLRIDPRDGACIDSVRITFPRQFPLQGNGLAAHPLTGELWAILRLMGVEGRELVTLDPASGRATSIGNLGTDMSALAFDHDGILYGVTGQTGEPPSTLCRIDPVTAELESLTTLSSGPGHALAYNPEEEFFVHAADEEIEMIDLYSLTVWPFPVSGFPWSSPKARTYAGDDYYHFAAEGSLFLRLDANGVCDSVGVTVPTKGLALGQWTVDAPQAPPRELVLRAWPNPFRGGTLHVVLSDPGAANRPVGIFDVRGRRVGELDPVGPGGTNTWSGRDPGGRPVPGGVYFLGGRKIVVVR
jgi:hypothetical protein